MPPTFPTTSESRLPFRRRFRNHKTRLVAQITSDPSDNIFLECADGARADYLVTGNQHHFPKF